MRSECIMDTPTSRIELERKPRTMCDGAKGTAAAPKSDCIETRPSTDETTPPRPTEEPDEARLFTGARSPRLFGEGSYGTGGPTAEGHYAMPDPNPQGGYGSFDDAGGYGSTELLGEHAPSKEPSKQGSKP